MVEWLEESLNGPSNTDIWGWERPYYNFTDLMKWLKMREEDGDNNSSDGGKKISKKVSKKGKVKAGFSDVSKKGKK
jgi:hypothetical protein